MNQFTPTPREPARNVIAVLGPTNTGKTHLAIERMLGHRDGVIGLPLRLLAREVYNRIVARVGAQSVALFTGEEKIVPATARYRVCTVEAMPSRVDASFVAIDEIQIAGDLERGHVFTDRMLNLRGRDETLLLGAATMRPIIEKLIRGVNIVTRPRMSVLSYTGTKKITRLPTRSAVVAFSSNDVYAIAELIRRQRGGAAVVLGALSPRTRNAQVEIYQSGDVDFLVATDAIGMGLNLDVKHVAFAADRKYDGYQHRRLTAAELGQIAGRAGRYMQDGTFGVTSRVDPLEDELVEDLESHRFEPVRTVQWRNRKLDFSSLKDLIASLDHVPQRPELSKAPPAEDLKGLHAMARNPTIASLVDNPERVELLWDVCQIPDYRKIAPANHVELLETLFTSLARDGAVPVDWFDRQLAFSDRTDGDIDTLSNRIAHVRTWTFATNRKGWFEDPGHWQDRTRAIEDRLSDALHERLTARFVDRRTSVLMRRLKENVMLEAEITETGDVVVEGQHIGTLDGFRFAPDPNAAGPEAKALRAAAQNALAGEVAARADQLARAPDSDFALATEGTLRWRGSAVARLIEGEDMLKPRLALLADDSLPEAARDRLRDRTELWLTTHAETLLKPLFDLRDAAALTPAARGVAFRVAEGLGIIERDRIADEIRDLDQDARAGMRALGVRFGAYHIYVPALLKPAPAGLIAMIWALKNGGLGVDGLQDLTQLAASGRTSVPVDAAIAKALYYAVGYKPCGSRAVRIDILERLADIVRPLIAWRPTADAPPPPDGAVDEYGFTVTVEMTSLLGCAGDDFTAVLRALGYRSSRRPAPKAESTAADGGADTPPQEAAETVAAKPASGESSATDADAAPTTMASGDEPATAADEGPAPASAASVDEPAAPTAEEASVPAAAASAQEPTPSSSQAPQAASAAKDGAPTSTDTPSEISPQKAPETAPVTAPETAPAPEVAPEVEAEPAFIEVWRPAPRNPPQRGPRDKARQEDAAARSGKGQTRSRHRDRKKGGKPASGDAAAGKQGAQRKPGGTRDKRPAAQVDPNSPFAALAALKNELEGRERDG
ncbi:MAG: helicase-related protein [Alphaproteobacteria bacterium]